MAKSKRKPSTRSPADAPATKSFATQSPAGAKPRRLSKPVRIALGLVALAGLWLVANLYLHRAVEAALRNRQLSRALGWSNLAQVIAPWSTDLKLTRARATRLAGDLDGWADEMAPFARRETDLAVAREQRLGRIQRGDFPDDYQSLMVQLLEVAPVGEVAEAFVVGFLLRGNAPAARETLNSWKKDEPDNPQIVYVEAIYSEFTGDHPGAVAQLTRYCAEYPDHQPARLRLAEFHIADEQPAQALAHLQTLTAQGDDSLSTATKLAHCQRYESAAAAGKALLLRALDAPREKRRPAGSPVAQAALRELAKCELELGDYADAARHFRAAGYDQLEPAHQSELALADYLSGQTTEAAAIYDAIAQNRRRDSRRGDLEIYLQLNPDDQAARQELESLSRKK